MSRKLPKIPNSLNPKIRVIRLLSPLPSHRPPTPNTLPSITPAHPKPHPPPYPPPQPPSTPVRSPTPAPSFPGIGKHGPLVSDYGSQKLPSNSHHRRCKFPSIFPKTPPLSPDTYTHVPRPPPPQNLQTSTLSQPVALRPMSSSSNPNSQSPAPSLPPTPPPDSPTSYIRPVPRVRLPSIEIPFREKRKAKKHRPPKPPKDPPPSTPSS